MASGIARLDDRYELAAADRGTRRAAVWLARDARAGREVTVTILRPDAAADLALARRFMEGAEKARAISHPHLATVLDIGRADGIPYVVTEPVAGPTAADLARVLGTLPAPAAVHLVGLAAQALGAAHHVGLVHGFVAPGSLATGRRGVAARVMGLGTAAVTDDGADAEAPLRIAALPYGAPEQLRDGTATPATDVYALGAVLHRLLAGRPAWSPGPAGLVAGRLTRAPRPPSSFRGSIPADLDAIVLRALAVDPRERFPDGAAFASALAAWAPEPVGVAIGGAGLAGAPPSPLPVTTAALASAVVTRVPASAPVPVAASAPVPVAASAPVLTVAAAEPVTTGSPERAARTRLFVGAALWLVALIVLALVGFGVLGPPAPSGSVLDATSAPAAATPVPTLGP